MRRILLLAALPIAAGACGSDGRAPTSLDDAARHGTLQRVLGGSDEELTTQDLSQGLTPAFLARVLAGPGIEVSNVGYSGAPAAAGMFSGGSDIVGFPLVIRLRVKLDRVTLMQLPGWRANCLLSVKTGSKCHVSRPA